MAGVVAMDRRNPWSADYIALARTDAMGSSLKLTSLPEAARGAFGFALEADGTVWFARACKDAIYRRLPSGKLTRFQLRGVGCSESAEGNSGMIVGPDGAAWLVNLAQKRAARVDANGRVREWRVAVPEEMNLWGRSTQLAADPRGGLAFADAAQPGEPQISGRVTATGKVRLSETAGTPAFGSDGTLWETTTRGLRRTAPDGRTTDITVPGAPDVFAVALARDGAPWFLGGTLWSGPSLPSEYLSLVAGGVPPGTESEVPAAAIAAIPAHSSQGNGIALGGDGAIWTSLWNTAGDQGRMVTRIVPSEIAAARKPVGSVRRVLARTGRTVVLQLACDAERGRFCLGKVRLVGATSPTPYVVEGQSAAAVRMTLGPRAARTLRRGRAVRTTAIVRSEGAGETRRALTLRR
ncbi:hypothetical protein Cwoe_3511 [Conexibacter woesei DSM 14684]|uniref:Uncharacterized protein n=2 Tax=Conexibacter TaxID=191494 RepID=D3F069_CONWI|nr:hypothetical protein Cwoe_3511 [Conexibacter woesei DSM 14684]